jgi:hypothetical protein
MNKKSKLSSKEKIFDVFRPHGDHDVSAENYLLKKQTQSQAISGPVVKNHFTDAQPSPASGKNELHTLVLSGIDDASNAADQALNSTATPNNDDPQTTIRLETFQIGMHERLASMQLAQQKAKDQLNDLEGQTQGTDKLPKS